MTPVPNDPCWRQEMVSPGAIQNLNGTLGKPQDVPQRVASINDLAPVEPNALASVGIQLVGYDPEEGGIARHATLTFASGSTQSGVLSFENPGVYAHLKVQCIPDAAVAKGLARANAHYDRKSLNVVPDLKTPSIQACVGRAYGLGAGEQFPYQLWAACAQKNGSDLIPPTSREKHWTNAS